MAAWIRSSPRLFLPLIRTMIVSGSGLDVSRVFFVALPPEQVNHYSAAADCLIQLLAETGNNAIESGSGYVDDRRTLTTRIHVRSRCYLDVQPADTDRLLNSVVGHLQLVDLVYTSIAFQFPTDSNGNVLTNNGFPGPVSQPNREIGTAGGDNNWIYSSWDIGWEYLRDLSGNSNNPPAGN